MLRWPLQAEAAAEGPQHPTDLKGGCKGHGFEITIRLVGLQFWKYSFKSTE